MPINGTHGMMNNIIKYGQNCFREAGAGGSNPLAPTIFSKGYPKPRTVCFSPFVSRILYICDARGSALRPTGDRYAQNPSHRVLVRVTGPQGFAEVLDNQSRGLLGCPRPGPDGF